MLSKALGSLLCSILLVPGVASAVIPRDESGKGDSAEKWTDHNKVAAFSQKSSPGVDGELELRFNPLLYVAGGCDPYPAVDANGNLGAGLKPVSGGADGCDKGGTGQVYVRIGESHGRKAILYSYYVPKVRWAEGKNNGHRHYWASAIVWTKTLSCEQKASSFSAVGVSLTDYDQTWKQPGTKDISWVSSGDDLTQPKLQLHDRAMGPFVGADGSKVFARTLISWDSLNDAAQKALNDVKYEKTKVPFNEANFQDTLDAAYSPNIFAGMQKDQSCSPDSSEGGSVPGGDAPPGDDAPPEEDPTPSQGPEDPTPSDGDFIPGDEPGDEPVDDFGDEPSDDEPLDDPAQSDDEPLDDPAQYDDPESPPPSNGDFIPGDEPGDDFGDDFGDEPSDDEPLDDPAQSDDEPLDDPAQSDDEPLDDPAPSDDEPPSRDREDPSDDPSSNF